VVKNMRDMSDKVVKEVDVDQKSKTTYASSWPDVYLKYQYLTVGFQTPTFVHIPMDGFHQLVCFNCPGFRLSLVVG
jgi:hypothetical protein